MKVKEVLCNIGLLPGDTVIGCMGFDVRGKKYSDCQNYISQAEANVISITVLRVGDKFDLIVDRNKNLPNPTQYHIYCECGTTWMPSTEDQAVQYLNALHKSPCTHQTASTSRGAQVPKVNIYRFH